MFNEMICSRCKDVVEVSAKSVTLPFVCEECLTALASKGHTVTDLPPVQGITGGLVPSEVTPEVTPEPKSLSEILETEKGTGYWTDGNQQIKFTTPLPSDESTATIENTTLLIADLEQQVSDSKAALDTSTELIEDLTGQLAKAKENLSLYDEAGRTVTENFLRTIKQRDGWRNYTYEQSDRIEELAARINRLTFFNKRMGLSLQQQRERTKKYYERGLGYWKEAFFYSNLGFWGRLFNQRYDPSASR